MKCQTTDMGFSCNNEAEWYITADKYIKPHYTCNRCKNNWHSKLQLCANIISTKLTEETRNEGVGGL